MRGGASKGLFFYEADLPRRHEARDQLLVRLLGSPDTYERQLDGLGGATPDTSKVVIVSSSKRADCDVDFLIGEVSIKDGRIDYSKGCQDLADAVGPFAIHEGIVAPQNGITQVRAWQLSHDYRIDLFVPVQQGRVLETGQFQDIGLSFHAAEIRLELFEPPASNAAPVLLPTGSAIDTLQISGLGKLRVSVLHTADTFVFLGQTP